ncbi:MAG: hypothetical protein ACRCTM_05740 [Sphaerotilus sulfidivorans]|jgi:hypothetical protein|uniref:hypothetical protein n=1 Tax=Sphaerotilus sulfidivorans TaxID=639200 RepID=UPI003F30E6BC
MRKSPERERLSPAAASSESMSIQVEVGEDLGVFFISNTKDFTFAGSKRYQLVSLFAQEGLATCRQPSALCRSVLAGSAKDELVRKNRSVHPQVPPGSDENKGTIQTTMQLGSIRCRERHQAHQHQTSLE